MRNKSNERKVTPSVAFRKSISNDEKSKTSRKAFKEA